MSPLDPSQHPEVQALTAQSDQLATLAQTYSVTTPLQFEDAGEQLKQIKGAMKRLETVRKSMTQPLDTAKKAIMDFFRGPEEKLLRAESGIKRAMIGYTQEQERIRQEEQRKADEIARKEQAKLAEQARKAEAAGNIEKAAQLEERAATVVAPVIQREPPMVSGINMRDVWKFEVIDAAKVPREFLMVDESKIRKYVAAMKGDATINGVRIYSEKQMASGAA